MLRFARHYIKKDWAAHGVKLSKSKFAAVTFELSCFAALFLSKTTLIEICRFSCRYGFVDNILHILILDSLFRN